MQLKSSLISFNHHFDSPVIPTKTEKDEHKHMLVLFSVKKGMSKNLYIITNLFNLFMNEVDSWVIFDNSENPRKLIASGGRNADTVIDEEMLFSMIKSYVK